MRLTHIAGAMAVRSHGSGIQRCVRCDAVLVEVQSDTDRAIDFAYPIGELVTEVPGGLPVAGVKAAARYNTPCKPAGE